MGTVQHRDLAGEELHPPGVHANQHRSAGSDPLAPTDIGAAAAAHQHDAAYAALGHHHNAAYAALGHHHDAAYAAQSHNHNTAYAPIVHNHDAAYAAQGHDHADLVKGDGTRAFSAPVEGKQFYSTPQEQTSPGPTVIIDWATGKSHRIAMDQDCSVSFMNAVAGQMVALEFEGGYTPTFLDAVWWEGGILPTWGNSVGSPDIIVVYFNGTDYFAQVFGLGFVLA